MTTARRRHRDVHYAPMDRCVLKLVLVTTIPIVRFVASIKSVSAVCVSPMTALVRGVKPITFALETCVMVQHRLVRGVDRIEYVAI